MRRIWSYGLALALSGCVTSGQASSGAGTYVFYDALKPHGHARGEAAEQAATRICDGGRSANIGTASFYACMRRHGWRFDHFVAASSPPDSGSDYSSPPPPPDPPPPPPYVPVAPSYDSDGNVMGYM